MGGLTTKQGLYPFKLQLDREGIIFCYSGPFTQGLTEVTGDIIRTRTGIRQEKTNTSLKIFAVFIEMVQNVINYTPDEPGSNQNTSEGVIVIGTQKEAGYFVFCGNAISPADGSRMGDRLDRLQQMDAEELKQHYREQRRKDPDEYSKGAGLGFIEIARKSSRFTYAVTPEENGLAFFELMAYFDA
jgi:hypothetical protein